MSKYNVYVHTATHAGHTRIAFDYEKVHAELELLAELNLSDQGAATVAKLYADQVAGEGIYQVNTFSTCPSQLIASEDDVKLGNPWSGYWDSEGNWMS